MRPFELLPDDLGMILLSALAADWAFWACFGALLIGCYVTCLLALERRPWASRASFLASCVALALMIVARKWGPH